jgi:UDP-N-acetylmuramoyl-L-alanyl-D-glutamate--2,6-diaminopimelate ligase
MKQIAVVGSTGQEAAASLIGATLRKTAGWKVGVLGPEEGSGTPLTQGLHRLEEEGCDCAIAALRPGPVEQVFQLGILTGWQDSRPPLAVEACEKLVVNLDDPGARALAGRRAALTYSEGKNGADLTAKYLRCYPTRTEFDALTWKEIQRVRMPVLGGYDLYQGLAALGCGLRLGISLNSLARSVEEAAGVPGHLEEVAPGQLPFRVVVDEARTAASLESLLLTLRPLRGEGGKLRLVLGQRMPGEENLMELLAKELADQVWFLERQPDALRLLAKAGQPGDVLAVSGIHRPGSAGDERPALGLALKQRERKDD